MDEVEEQITEADDRVNPFCDDNDPASSVPPRRPSSPRQATV
jgi:hypothetical protein